MSGSRLLPADWLRALESAFAELASGTLGLQLPAAGEAMERPPVNGAGAYLPLLGPSGSVQVALVSSAEGCAAVARGLLALPPEEPLGPTEVADAVCEVVNLLAGSVKTKLRERMRLQLGLPTFFHGTVQPTDRLGVEAVKVRSGGLEAALVVVHPRT
jgi:hypothetical protein